MVKLRSLDAAELEYQAELDDAQLEVPQAEPPVVQLLCHLLQLCGVPQPEMVAKSCDVEQAKIRLLGKMELKPEEQEMSAGKAGGEDVPMEPPEPSGVKAEGGDVDGQPSAKKPKAAAGGLAGLASQMDGVFAKQPAGLKAMAGAPPPVFGFPSKASSPFASPPPTAGGLRAQAEAQSSKPGTFQELQKTFSGPSAPVPPRERSRTPDRQGTASQQASIGSGKGAAGKDTVAEGAAKPEEASSLEPKKGDTQEDTQRTQE